MSKEMEVEQYEWSLSEEIVQKSKQALTHRNTDTHTFSHALSHYTLHKDFS